MELRSFSGIPPAECIRSVSFFPHFGVGFPGPWIGKGSFLVFRFEGKPSLACVGVQVQGSGCLQPSMHLPKCNVE